MTASRTRRALDQLLALHPHLDLVAIDWQPPNETSMDGGPWLLVELGQPSDTFDTHPAWAVWKFAIWKATGAVHLVGPDGAVADDPITIP